jgi:putative PIN family toxin of toxin-antitoxin system
MKIIVDVNVWISAILWDGVPDQILQLAEDRKITIFASQPLLVELEATLNRRKFQARLQALDLTVDNIINAAQDIINFCPTTTIDVPQLRDPKDLTILAAAMSAGVDAIVTGDLDLLVLTEFNGIFILNPQDFLNRYFPS